jgi:hypothetical protein
MGFIAGSVLIFSPFTNTGMALMVISGPVALICLWLTCGQSQKKTMLKIQTETTEV